MTVETINPTLFPPFLFSVLFCSASVFLYHPKKAAFGATTEELTPERPLANLTTSTVQSDSVGGELKETPTGIEPLVESNQSRDLATTQLTAKRPTKEINFVTKSDQTTVSIPTINTSLISLRQARKIASAIKAAAPELRFKLKVNGSDSSLEWLQAQIKNRLETAPELVMPIILNCAPAAVKTETTTLAVSNKTKAPKMRSSRSSKVSKNNW